MSTNRAQWLSELSVGGVVAVHRDGGLYAGYRQATIARADEKYFWVKSLLDDAEIQVRRSLGDVVTIGTWTAHIDPLNDEGFVAHQREAERNRLIAQIRNHVSKADIDGLKMILGLAQQVAS